MTHSTVILAAGQGKRMHSATPKVLHRLAGKALLEHVVNTTSALKQTQPPIIVYGHEGAKIKMAMASLNVTWVEQTQQLGTGHALMQALPHLPMNDLVLILYGDVPLISVDTLNRFIAATPKNAVGILTAYSPNPQGLGRIIRDLSGKIIRIIEEKDANEEERAITEINTGIYLIPANLLHKWLPTIKNHNSQKEHYLTDVIALAAQDGILIQSSQPADYQEVCGINDRIQLALLERYYQKNYAEKLMLQGVTFADPSRFDVRGDLQVGQDTTIDINVITEGLVKIGNNCVIGANITLRNTIIGDNVEIKSHSVIDGAKIAENCVIGPFARIRPGTILAPKSHVGNFVEIKNSEIGTGSKINHLSYVGDSDVGKHVNIGAGTITCNYDGANKHRTVIGDNVFIGSSSQLVAPINIGEGATIGAGSTVTRNAPAHQLTVCRSQQRSIENWQRPSKKEEN